VKEIYEYANLKSEDGVCVAILRKMKIKSEQYATKIEDLKQLIK
jgi:hypothetical protein